MAALITLQNGVEMPMAGFGTAFFEDARVPEQAWRGVYTALEVGYRHIDTARMYGCERQVGDVLSHYFMLGKLSRKDVFITTKVAHPPHPYYPDCKTQYIYKPELSAYDGIMREFEESLTALGLGYVDLLLLHWPGVTPWNTPVKDEERPSPELAQKKREEMWRAVEEIYDKKLARAIGVSNYTQKHLEALMPMCRIKPMMNQIEIHPYCAQVEMVKFCQSEGIRLTAYSPLANGKGGLLEDPVLVDIAAKRGVSPGKLVLCWMAQRGIVVIPKSSNPGRMADNLALQTDLLSSEELDAITALDKSLHTCPDPAEIP
mmetsp:Transcript_6588/g.14329  ORF Transcript_6588/g.14329 Transcript_6588/m.14329 type:complete len:317 (-) Transcript_6588:174-1124(-)